MRNHNNDVAKDQDPAAFSLQAQEIIRNALLTRYTLLPYLYNLFYLSHTRGDTVVRPLLFEFLADKNTHLIDRQFMFGPAFLISPCLEQGATSVKAYFPSDTWYRYDTGELIKANGSYVTLDAPLEMINVHVRGGFIVPYQFPSVTTVESRANPFCILVALKQQADGSSRAVGEMFWDDGESIDSVEQVKYNTFKFESEQTSKSGMLTISCKEFGYNTTMNLGEIKVYGVISVPRQVQINSVDHGQYEYIDSVRVLHISYSGPRLDEEQPINVSWIF
jgi:lysosomal alpha-glucosidase